MATDAGLVPAAYDTGVAKLTAEVVLVLRSTNTFVVLLATATSCFPSPFKSPIANAYGLALTVKSVFVAKLIEVIVVFRKTETTPKPSETATISGFPSPVISPIPTNRGPVDTSKYTSLAKLTIPGVL